MKKKMKDIPPGGSVIPGVAKENQDKLEKVSKIPVVPMAWACTQKPGGYPLFVFSWSVHQARKKLTMISATS